MTCALIYHDVAAAPDADRVGFPGRVAGRYKIAPEAFERHLDAIAATGRRVGLLDDGADVALTFDDGGASALEIARRLERRGWRGYFFVTTGRIGTRGFVGRDEVRELVSRGHVVGSHSHTHPTYMGRLTAEELRREWVTSRDALAELLGRAPGTASVPGGFLSRTVLEEAARAGYGLLMTSQPSARARTCEGMTVHGRYSIWADTPPATAAAFARGALGARARLWTEWKLKSAAKRLSPRVYDRLRRVRAGGA
jgi:peptidoglycan/xylan/chitin deacetylase (PgdA/CDA1 family)